MPFTEVVTQMPLYAKFLKEILSKKIRIAEEGVVNLTATCSVVIKKNLPEKMKDPGSFTIPCIIGEFEFQKALCDSGASINLMPLSVARKLSLGELTPTTVTLQMADRTMAKPEGVIEDVLVKVGKFIFFCRLHHPGHGRRFTSSSAIRKAIPSNWSCFNRYAERSSHSQGWRRSS